MNKSLSRYRVIEKIGAGGMGEVYRARDAHIGRDVAIKVIPASLSNDPERVKRFEQEARAAGALNHPNIVSIYDVGNQEGSLFIVMELLEGQSLRERIVRGPVPPRTAIDYATQIARGLGAAHSKGIVHRDLKPENLFLMKDGRVKLLDFGLAKLSPSQILTYAGDRTVSAPVTETGALLGTVGYMAPEQVRGESVDHRSDLFALGAILYEMLTGRRAFSGASYVETLSAILTDEPPPIADSRGVSPGLDAIVRHCLEKNPEERFQSARDIAFAVADLSGAGRGLAPRSRRGWRPWVALGAAFALAGYVPVYLAAKHSARLAPPSFHRLTYARGYVGAARFSSDGQTIVYSGAWEGRQLELFSTRPEGDDARPLGLGSAELLAISSLGEMALALRPAVNNWTVRSGTLARAPLAGGAARELLKDASYADWAPDGRQLAVVRSVSGHTLEYPIGRPLVRCEGWISHPRFSARGDRIAFIEHPVAGDERGRVVVTDMHGNVRRLTQEWASAMGLAWAASGREVWFTASNTGSSLSLYAVTLAGRLRPVARVPGGMTLYDISRSGRVLVAHNNIREEMRALIPGEATERDFSWLDWGTPADISEDGSSVLFGETGEGAGTDWGIFLRKTDGSPAVRLGDGIPEALSPDGRWALAIPNNRRQLILLPTGAGDIRTLGPQGGVSCFPIAGVANWLPTGDRVVFWGGSPGKEPQIFVQAVAGGGPKPISPPGVLGFRPTPDGRYIAGTDSSQRVILFPVDRGEPRGTAARLTQGEAIIHVTEDGGAVLVNRYARSDGSPELPAKVFRINLKSGRRDLVRTIMPPDPAGICLVSMPMMTPDGRSYVYSYLRLLSNLELVDGLK
jgi:eukaryotic-like serine/threonine-protein kinase